MNETNYYFLGNDNYPKIKNIKSLLTILNFIISINFERALKKQRTLIFFIHFIHMNTLMLQPFRTLKYKATKTPTPSVSPVPSPSASSPITLSQNLLDTNTTLLIVCLSILAVIIVLIVVITLLLSKKRKKGTI